MNLNGGAVAHLDPDLARRIGELERVTNIERHHQPGGVHPGTKMTVEGVVGDHHEKLATLNPEYTLLGA